MSDATNKLIEYSLHNDPRFITLVDAYRRRYNHTKKMQSRLDLLAAIGMFLPHLFTGTEKAVQLKEKIIQQVDDGDIDSLFEFISAHREDLVRAQITRNLAERKALSEKYGKGP